MNIRKANLSVGETIRFFRKEKGYSIRYLASASGLSRSTISRWENNQLNPSVENLKKIYDALDITQRQFWEHSPGWICTDTDKKQDIRKQINRIVDDMHDIQIAINILRENHEITISEVHDVETVMRVVLTKGIDTAADAMSKSVTETDHKTFSSDWIDFKQFPKAVKTVYE